MEERFGIEGLMGVETALVTLSPDFVAALKDLAPKKRRSKVPLVVLLAIAAVLFALGMDKSTREFAITKARARGIGIVHQPQAPAPVVVTAVAAPVTPAVAVPTVVRPQVIVDDPTQAPSDPPKAGKKPTTKPTKKVPGAASLKNGAGLVASKGTSKNLGS
jgi:hypothetical protein